MGVDWVYPASALASIGQQVGLWRWELATNRVQWSDHLFWMLGLDRSDFDERYASFVSRLHKDDRKSFEDRIAVSVNSGEPFRADCRFRHMNGRDIDCVVQAKTLLDDTGKPAELIGTVVDVSNEARITSDLKESELSLQSLAENVPGAIFRYVLRPDGSDEIEYMSSGCTEIWELTSAEIQGDPKALWSVVIEEDLPAMQASVMDSAANLTSWHHRWRIMTPSGVLKHLEGRGLPAKLPDGSVLWNSLILDVSEETETRKELLAQQAMLGQAQKMEAIGRIAGGIAHDFNNLLAIVLGNAQLMDEASTEADRRQFVAGIVDACKRGSHLTQHLLSFARRSTLNPSVLDVGRSIREISDLVRRVIPENIAVVTEGAADLWATAVDVAFFENSVLNLCLNARDAMPNGGKLSIETSNVRITSEPPGMNGRDLEPGRYVLVAVTDTGSGIPPEEIEMVVEPFYSTKAPDFGSGLGLAMVDGFVRQSRGALRIYSEPGVGTSVKIYLPAVEKRSESDLSGFEVPETADSRPASGRILIVEDEEAILRVLETTLARAGYSVSIATGGDEALLRFGDQANDFDILLTDVVMPGKLQGPELAAKLTERASNLKVVFMTGYPNEAVAYGDNLRQSDQFLMKPVLRQELLKTLSDVLMSQQD